MHRRHSSKGPDQRKSTSSIKHEPIDPELGRQHALTAATLAFARAQERKSADGGLSRNNTNNHKQDRNMAPRQGTVGNADPVVRRQQSVRFVGPNGIQRSQSVATRATKLQPMTSTATLRPMAITTNAPVPAAFRPPSRSSSIGKASIRGATAQYEAGNAFDEYYTRDDDIASTPSSYRRLRKSKSMFSPLKAPSVFYTNGTPERRNSYMGTRSSVSQSQTPSTQPTKSFLRAPKSMSFLRARRDQSERNDNAVQLARDRFFRDTAEQRLREQPSFLFRSKAQKQEAQRDEKPFRKSVRTSSTNSYGLPVASSNQVVAPKEHTLKGAARKASKTIKKSLLKVFGRSSKDDEPVVVPNQQVDARETHVRQYNGSDSAIETFFNVPHPDEGSLSRVATRVPDLHAVSSNQQLRSTAVSIKSFKSESDNKSRVTSWTNTVGSKATQAQIEKEQQRLSIINEVGTHVPSSSMSRARLSNQFSAYPVIHRPIKSAGHVQPPPPGAVDSARVYSALMKRLDENSPEAKLEASRNKSMDSLTARNLERDYSASASSQDHTPATIGQVPPSTRNTSTSQSSISTVNQWNMPNAMNGSSLNYNFPAGTYCQPWTAAEPTYGSARHADDVFSPKDLSRNKENVPMGSQGRRPAGNPFLSVPFHQDFTKSSYLSIPGVNDFSSQESVARREPASQPRILRESRSTFFGGSGYTVSRTPSPYRRAMTESDYSPGTAHNLPLPTRTPPLRNPLYLAPGTISSKEFLHVQESGGAAYSESVYYRSTSGQTLPAESQVSLPLQKTVREKCSTNHLDPGDAVILECATYRPTMPNGSGHRTSNSAGSTEWKKWMSSEVAKMERTKENGTTSYVNYALPTMSKPLQQTRHIREPAQIIEDDVEVAQRKVSAIKQPLGLVQQQNPNIQTIPVLRPILKNRSTVSLVESEPIPTITPMIPIPPPPPPPIPQRSPLRTMQSRSSIRSIGTIHSITSAPNSAIKVSSLNDRNVLLKRNISQGTLRSIKSVAPSTKSVETPVAKLVKKNRRTSVSNSGGSPGATIGIHMDWDSSAGSRYRTPGSGGPAHYPVAGSNIGSMEVFDEGDPYGIEGAGLMGPVTRRGGAKSWGVDGERGGIGGTGNEGGNGGKSGRMSVSEGEAQAMGSKQMVDLFLSSRRRRMVSESEGAEVGFVEVGKVGMRGEGERDGVVFL